MLFGAFLDGSMVERTVCKVSYPALEVTDGVAAPILINLSDSLCPILIRKSKKITCIL